MDVINQLAEYSGWNVILVLVIVLFSVEAVLKAGSYFWEKAKARFKKEEVVFDAVDEHDDINKKLDTLAEKVSSISDDVALIKKQNDAFQGQIDELNSKSDLLSEQIVKIEGQEKRIQKHLLDDTKGFIVGQYHRFYYQMKCIDDISMQNLEDCYRHYKENGGNGFLDDVMHKLRELPRTNPNL